MTTIIKEVKNFAETLPVVNHFADLEVLRVHMEWQ